MEHQSFAEICKASAGQEADTQLRRWHGTFDQTEYYLRAMQNRMKDLSCNAEYGWLVYNCVISNFHFQNNQELEKAKIGLSFFSTECYFRLQSETTVSHT